MKFHVMRGHTTLGEFAHESTDDGMGIVHGELRPTDRYAEVQQFFRRLSDIIDRGESVPKGMWADRDELGLLLQADDGTAIATEWIMIYDFGPELDIAVDAALADAGQLKGYFKTPENGV